jgi:type I restriction enzyme R subunit
LLKHKFSEDALVQRTTAEYLEKQLGWESLFAYNDETFGPDGLLGRVSDRDFVLTKILRAKLVEFNPGLPEKVYDDAVRQVVESPSTQSLVAINREKYDQIRNGVQVTYRNEKGERVRERLRFFDFLEPDNNHFLCVRELWVKGVLYRRRPDTIGFVNGLPLLFIECKNIHKDLKVAFEDNYSDYRDTIPQIFHHNAIVLFGNGDKAKIGTITSNWEHFHEWKRLSEEDPGVVDMETLLKGICDKKNFMDLLENFILFDDSAGGTKKILARNHQFLGVNRAIKSVEERKERQGKLGVFWHTQGAGKSYSMVMFTRKVHRRLGGNFTFLVLTDREDLDTQIYKTFAGCGVVDNDSDPCRASSGDHLNQLLSQHKSFVFSLIQKFNQRIEPGEEYSQRDDIIVITDEAHRTQYGTLALNMRDALPNASYIGFTGTPLFKDDEITRRVFGDYVSTYDFQRAVEDKATVPLFYDARGDKLGIAIKDLDEKIAEKLEEIDFDDLDMRQNLEKELKRDYHIITAGKRLDQVARDFVQHYSISWESGKAMFVCIDKITCVRMYRLIEFYWHEHIRKLEKELRFITDEQEEQFQRRRIEWMKQTRMAVVVSEEQGEVDKFRKWDLDIQPHRKLIKEGMDLPDHMRQKPEFRNMQRLALDDAFKAEEHPFRIAIVCAMWLTGFDVPCLSNLYLDKPLKAHTLMQAIARANRVNEGKTNGLIIDYCGILKNLRKALATFAGSHDSGRTEDGDGKDPTKPNDDLLSYLAEAITLVKEFLLEGGASLEDIANLEGFSKNAAIVKAKEVANTDDHSRKKFEVMCREVFKLYKACCNVEGINNFRNDRDAIDVIYKSLQQDRNMSDISDVIRQLHELVDGVIETVPDRVGQNNKTYDISKIDFDRLKREFERSPAKRTTVQNLKQIIEQRLNRLMEQNPMRSDFQRHYEKIIDEYNREKDRLNIEKTFEELLTFLESLDEEESRAVREGLDEESLALFDLLKKPDLSSKEIKRIKEVSVELLRTLKEEKLKIDHWQDKEATRDSVRLMIGDFLWDDATGLPEDCYTENDVKAKTEEVFQHVFRVYPTLPSPYYEQGVVV